jgi:apolipoprotein N-acyltransferase
MAYAPFWRVVVAVLVAMRRAGLLGMVFAILFLETRLDNQLRLLRTFVVVGLAPGLAAWLLARAFAAAITIDRRVLRLQRRDEHVEIPCESIVAVVPWTVPLPGDGVWLRLKSGRRFRYGLQVSDPVALIDALAGAGAGGTDALREAARHPAAVYGRSRARPRRWYRPLLEYVLFALVPTIPLFRLHQWVAYGGTFGEYYTYGLQAYLLGFAAYWWTFTIYLVLYAAVLRTAAEAIVLAIAWLAPDRVAPARTIVEWGYRLLYFGSVPAFLLRIAMLSS